MGNKGSSASYKPLVDVGPQGQRPHETQSVDTATRMQLNGENPVTMEHAMKIKQRREDHSVDQPWEVDPSLACADLYAKICTVIWFIPKMIVFYPLFMITQIIPVLVCRAYLASLPVPCDAINRSTPGFMLLLLVLCILALPTAILVVLLLLLDCMMYYIFGILYCTLTCGWSRYCESLKAIRPYQGGPMVIFYIADVVVAFLGQLNRQGVCEGCGMLAGMWLFMPWFKYFLCVNPWLYPLEERFVQQISTSMQDLSTDEVSEAALRIISRSKQTEEVRAEVDSWRFSPHYPYPPPGRRWAVGMQSGGSGMGKAFYLLVHTTHNFCQNGKSTEQFVLSNSALAPVWRVMLWYNNPYHFLCGWVEASVSTGEPSQRDKPRSAEHPMWLVTSRSPFLSDRSAFTGVGMIDAFFDYFLPFFVRQLRTMTRGPEEAKRLDEGVISKDGISRPEKGHEVPRSDPGKGIANFYVSEQFYKTS